MRIYGIRSESSACEAMAVTGRATRPARIFGQILSKHSTVDIMNMIEFSGVGPAYCAAGPSLQCQARIDGAPACYGITAEALEDHFGARSCRCEDLLSAYQKHRVAIEAMARRLFEVTGARSIVLHSGHFRFGV